jgi:hypothetical protein
MFVKELFAPQSGCFTVDTVRWLVLVQVLLLVIFIGVFGLVFSSMDMDEEVDLTVPCSAPILNISWHWKVGAACAFGFVMNILVPVVT